MTGASTGLSPTSIPSQQSYINNPNQYQSFDTSGLTNSEINQGNAAGANQIAQAKAQAAGMGAGRGSQAGNAVAGIQAGLGENAQNIANNNALTSYNQQLEQQQANNNFNLGEQGLQQQQYAQQQNAANTQAGQFNTLLGSAGGTIGGVTFGL